MMLFDFGDRCFAKVKGFPHWPARINCLPGDVKIPKGKYPIFFYGTHEVCFLSGNAIFPYEKYKSKYGVSRNTIGFNIGLEEMETNATIYQLGVDPNAISFLSQFYIFSSTEPNILPPKIQPTKLPINRTDENSDPTDSSNKDSSIEDSNHMDMDQKSGVIPVTELDSAVMSSGSDSNEFKNPNDVLKQEPMDEGVLISSCSRTDSSSSASIHTTTATFTTTVTSSVHDQVVNVALRKPRHIKHYQPSGSYVNDFTNLLLEIRKYSWSKTKISDIKRVMKKNKTDSRVRIFFPWYQSLAKK